LIVVTPLAFGDPRHSRTIRELDYLQSESPLSNLRTVLLAFRSAISHSQLNTLAHGLQIQFLRTIGNAL
jgi:hypothetical protein